jgi:hypothetical protein
MKKLEISPKAVIADWILPPKILHCIVKLRRLRSSSNAELAQPHSSLEQYLTEEWSLLTEALSGANAYLEFGCGLSTEFVSKSYGCRIRSVDTSADWVALVQKRVREDVEILHIDLGEVVGWGTPATYDHRQNFVRYFEAGFDGGFDPDVILVDGRFRVACFFSSLLLAGPGTKIVFDDYPMRPHYQIVEEILQPKSISSRQALFVIPSSIDVRKVRSMRDKFAYVMD